MARIIVELTNRCNLRCRHCFDERHAATGDLSMVVVDRLLDEGHGCGIDHLCFTGGEPSLHRRFDEIVSRASEAGYSFSFVSNGVSVGVRVEKLTRTALASTSWEIVNASGAVVLTSQPISARA